MDKYYLITGQNADAEGSVYLTYPQVLSSTNLIATSVSRNNISFAIPRVDWSRGNVFSSYTEENNANSYAVYNNNVYLCLSNNIKNIKNITNSSTYPPTHLVGKVLYDDGYTWLFLYSITSTVFSLTNRNFIPAPSSHGLKSLVIDQEIDDVVCSGSTGNCTQYVSQVGGTVATLFYSEISTCSECSTIAEETTKTDLLWTRFYNPSDSIPSTISLFDYTTSLDSAISNNKINPNTNLEAKTYMDAKSSGLLPGCILSANINLAGIALDEIEDSVSPGTYLTLLSSESTITATGGEGTGASVEFIINTNQIVGINLINGGTNYRAELATILLPGITSVDKSASLINNIELVGTPASLTFSNTNSIFDVASQNSIGEDRVVNIVNAKVDAATTANFYAIVKTDPGKTAVADIIPSKLAIFPFGSTGAVGKEFRNLIFVQSINIPEVQRR